MTFHVLETLSNISRGCEIWLDSSPLVYEPWKLRIQANNPDQYASFGHQLDRLLSIKEGSYSLGSIITGVTTNPSLMLQFFSEFPQTCTDITNAAANSGVSQAEKKSWAMYVSALKKSADFMRPLWNATYGQYGFVSAQVDPRHFLDYEAMFNQGLELAEQATNIMVKIPGSLEGYAVIEALTAKGISTNSTVSFSVSQHVTCMDAVTSGRSKALANGIDLSGWRSVITHMSARFSELGELEHQAKQRNIALTDEEKCIAEIAILKRAYDYSKSLNHPSKFLLSSMRVVRTPDAKHVMSHHLNKTVGLDIIYTCPLKFIRELRTDNYHGLLEMNHVEEGVDPSLLDRLLNIPCFREAYEFDGIKRENFVNLVPFKATVEEFSKAFVSMTDLL